MEFLMRVQIFLSGGTATEVFKELRDATDLVAAMPSGTNVTILQEPLTTADTTRPFQPNRIGGVMYNNHHTDDTILLKQHQSYPDQNGN
jgi:hypothetical protein